MAAVIDALASERHFVDHIAPVWRALPAEARGIFSVHHSLVNHAAARGIPEAVALTSSFLHRQEPVIVAAYGDYRRTISRRVIYMEHGSGQSYDKPHTSYVGGPGRERVALFLCPSERVAQQNAAAWPAARSVACGAPRTDRWMDHRPANAEPVVAISFHWDCKVAPESRSAWTHFYPGLKSLAAAFPGRILGHAHPRLFSSVRGPYKAFGIEPVEDFEEIMRRADLYAVDNSSTLFEFAATGRPVVVLNDPRYRRSVDLWPRFWWGADVGIQADTPQELIPAIRRALTDPPPVAARRATISAELYAHLGHASDVAAEEIIRWLS